MKLIEINGDYNKDILKSFYIDDYGLGLRKHCIIFNGSIEMAKLIRHDLHDKCQPVIYSNFENYKCSKYYSYFGQYLFNDKYALITLTELKRNLYFYYGIYGKEGMIFIRPDSGEKTFQAQVLDIIDFDRFYNKNIDLQHELVLISTPKNIVGEWRIIVSRDDIIDYSLYRYQGQTSKIRSIPKEALDLARQLLKIGYNPDSVYCFDICSDSDNNYWLLELTSFSSAGLYASNKENIVREVSKIALGDFNK